MSDVVDFKRVLDEVTEGQSYGVHSQYPNYFEETIRWNKRTSAQETKLKFADTAKQLIFVEGTFKSDNELFIQTLPEHGRKIFQTNKRNVLMEKWMLQGALSVAPPEIKSRADEISAVLDRAGEGFSVGSPDGPVEIPTSGFWNLKEADDLKKEMAAAGKTKLKTGAAARIPPEGVWFDEKDQETLWDKVYGKEIRRGLWVQIRAEEITFECAMVFPVIQGLEQKLRPCVDFRKKNIWMVAQEFMRLVGVRGSREIQFRCLSSHGRSPMTFFGRRDTKIDVSKEKSLRDALRNGEEQARASAQAVQQKESNSDKYGPGAEADKDTAFAFVPNFFCIDLEAWYYQAFCKNPELNCMWIPVPKSRLHQAKFPVKCPKSGQHFQAIKSYVLVFGSLVSVHECVACSEVLMLWSVLLLRIIIQVYIDDGMGCARRNCLKEAQALYLVALAVAGKPESTEKRLSHLLQRCIVMLGIAYEIGDRMISASIPEERAAILTGQLQEAVTAVRAGNLKRELLESIRGSFRWCTQMSRSATLYAAVLNNWCKADWFKKKIKKKSFRKLLIFQLDILGGMVKENRKHTLSLDSVEQSLLHVFSDAAGEFEAIQHKQRKGLPITDKDILNAEIFVGGWINLGPSGSKKAFRIRITTVPRWVLDSVTLHIGIFEILGVLCVFSFLGIKVTSGRVVVCHLDNLGDTWALSRMATSCVVSRAVACAFLIYVEENDLNYYPAWIAGERNVLADAATRKFEIIRQVFPETELSFPKEALVQYWWRLAEGHFRNLSQVDPGGRAPPSRMQSQAASSQRVWQQAAPVEE